MGLYQLCQALFVARQLGGSLKFSSSLLSNWENCQQQAAFKHLDGLEDSGTHAKTWFGTCVHAALEEYNLWEMETGKGDVDVAKRLFLSMWEKPAIYGGNITEWRGSQYGTLRLKGLKILEEYDDKQKWEPREVIAAEHKFCVPLGEHLLSGIVDLVEWKLSGRGVPTLRICDYKNTSKAPTLKELRLNLQFTIYTYASLQPEFWLGYVEEGWHPPMIQKYAPMVNGAALYERFMDAPRRAVWSHLWGGIELDAGSRVEEDFERMYVLLEGIQRAIEHKVFIPSIRSASCEWCAFKPVCKAVIPVLEKMDLEPGGDGDDGMF